MADARISQLPAATTLASADIVPFTSISASEPRKITANNLGLVLTQLGLTVGTSAPATPYNGQLWVDTSTSPPILKVWNGATFSVVSFQPGSSVITSPSATAPSNPVLGQLWQDTSQTPDELKMYDGTNFVRVDPDGITQAAADLRYLQITAAASTYLALSGGTLTGDLTLTGAPTTDNMAATKKYVDDEIAAIPSASDLTPAGTVIWTARSTAPTGYLKANGAAVSRTTYATLFSAIGTQFGAGDGSTTFNLPDLRGEFVRGLDDGRGIDAGRTLGSTQADQNKQHNHGGTTSTASLTGTFTPGSHVTNPTGVFSDGGNVGSPEEGDFNNGRRIDLDVSHSHTISNDGGTESRPRNVALLGCIKT